MSATVRIPTQLRPLVGDHDQVDAIGNTVKEVIADLGSRHPGLAERLLDEGGQLRRFINVYVNDEDIRFLQGLDSRVERGARIAIIPAVAGGT
ncbi:MAG: ubiquitin-like small modifier protein 1 [Actinomycetota bacterium]